MILPTAVATTSIRPKIAHSSGNQGEGHDEPQRDARRGMHRRIAQGQRGGQELGFVRMQRRSVRFAAMRPGVAEDLGVTFEQVGDGVSFHG